MSIQFGTGDLGIIEAGSFRYRLTWDDLLWTARMLEGECGLTQGAGVHGAAVMWCMASRLIVARGYRTYKDLILAYSQPINPKWRRDGEFCRPGGRHYGTDRCDIRALDTRDRLKDKRWEEFPDAIQENVYRWATGLVENPIPRAVHFAVPAVCASGIRRAVANNRNNSGDAGWEFVWDSTGRTEIDPNARRGNCFLSTNASRLWPARHVKVTFSGNTASDRESTPSQDEVEQSSGGAERRPLDESGGSLTIPPNRIIDRTSAITSDRTEPPETRYNYFTVPTEYPDRQAQRELSESEEVSLLFTNITRFKNQVNSIRQRSNIEFTQALPIILITTTSEQGDLVNLNEVVFGATPYEFSQTQEELNFESFPDRPIASIQSFDVMVQETSAGVTSLQVGTLNIKIHNADLVTRVHPRGKYVAYMMQQGFVMRIRYGISSDDVMDAGKRFAFQWREEDFFVSHYDVTLNNDKTMDLKVSLMTATQRLLNQIKIGQSIPVSSLGRISDQDIDNIISNVVSGQEVEDSQVQQLRNNLSFFRSMLETPGASPGVGLIESRISGSFGFQLHAALTNSNIFDEEEGANSIAVQNMVEGIQGIQNILLTRRFESLLTQDCYRDTVTNSDAPRNVVNIGPLIVNIVKPEIDYTFAVVSRNQIEIGEKFSSDSIRQINENRRTNVSLIFGRFNSRAGTWANKPISSFPINVEEIFSELRRQRSVGDFCSSVNGFMNRISNAVADLENFNADTSQGAEPIKYRIQVPRIKYVIYPSPQNDTDWIMYVYDSKLSTVQILDMMDSLRFSTGKRQRPTNREIKDLLERNSIPWIEMGEEGNFIKSASAASQSDDALASNAMVLANRGSHNLRDMDQSVSYPAGISREFMASSQMTPQNIIRAVQYVPPITVSVSSYVLATAYFMAPIFVFFPISTFTGLYLVNSLRHDIKSGGATTNLELRQNLSLYNFMAL
jgi:hypothetical protein